MTPKQARKLVEAFAGLRVAVIGDLMLDRYIIGSAARISPEAPVPVVRVRETRNALGGAANVLRNLTGLGASAAAFGMVGQDAVGDEIVATCRREGIRIDGILRHPTRPSIVKTRLIADHQQVARIDEEDDRPLGSGYRRQILQRLEAQLDAGALDAVILEDYNKGLLTRQFASRVLKLCQARCIPVALDPHPGNPLRVTGLTLLTPNRREAFDMAGLYFRPGVIPLKDDKPLLRVGAAISRTWKPVHLLITLGAEGMALFGTGAAPFHVPTVAKEVFDVSGAGDTVIATFTLALLAGASERDAAVIANHAAGVVVGHVGTVPITSHELLASFGA